MNKKKILIGGCAAVVAVLLLSCWMNSDAKLRRNLKGLCKSNDCRCFYNIVDYRFTPEEARVYWLISQEAKKRPNASSLEFTTPTTYRNILSALAVCQPQKAQPQQQVQEKPVEKPAEKAQGKAAPAAPKSKPIKK